MVSLSWIDFHYLALEFKESLIGARIDSFYGNHEELHIKLYKAGQKNLFLSSYISKGITITNSIKNQHNPKNGFVQYLRKYLNNGFIDEVHSYPKERILTITISKKNKEDSEAKKYYIHFEHFMGGQILLCNDKNEILKSLKNIYDEKIKESNEYQIPKKEYSFFKEFSIDVTQNLQDALKPLGIGKKYISLLSLMNGIDIKTPLNELNCEIVFNLEVSLKELLEYPLESSKIEKLILPFNVDKSEELNQTFSKSLFEAYSNELISNTSQKEPAKLTKLKKRLKEQESHLKKIETESDKLQEKGSKYYEEYQLLSEFLSKIKELVKEIGFSGLKEKVKENEKLKKIILQINEKEQKVTINLEELKKI